MRRLAKGKRVMGWALVAAIGLVGFYSRTANSGALEDQQKAAGAIVTQAKELANVQAERSRVAREAEKAEKPIGALTEMLSSCPKEARAEFMGSLAFLNGGVASAYVGGIKKCLSGEQMNDVLRAIGHTSPSALDDNGRTCRCGQVTRMYKCQPWNGDSCSSSSCSGKC